MPHSNVTILGSTETFVFGVGGKPEAVIRVRWMYGADHGPFTTDLPAASFTWQAFDDAIAARVQDFAARGV